MYDLINTAIDLLLVYGLSMMASLLVNFSLGITNLTITTQPAPATQEPTTQPTISPAFSPELPTDETTDNVIQVQFPKLPNPWDEPMEYATSLRSIAPHPTHVTPQLRLLPPAPTKVKKSTTKKTPTTKKSTTNKKTTTKKRA